MEASILQGLRDGDEIQILSSLQTLNETLAMASGELTIHHAIFVRPLVELLCHFNADITLLTLRALNNILDLEPRATYMILRVNALPLLVEQLMQVSDVDVVEESFKFLSQLSAEQPLQVLRGGGKVSPIRKNSPRNRLASNFSSLSNSHKISKQPTQDWTWR